MDHYRYRYLFIVNQGWSYTYVGVVIDHLLSWEDQIESVCKKTRQRIYFLRRLRSFGARREDSSFVFHFCDYYYECSSVL